MHLKRMFFVALLLAPVSIGRAFAAKYNVTDLGTLPGDTSSNAVAVNKSGQAVGAAFGVGAASSPNLPVLYSNGKVHNLGSLGGAGGVGAAAGINNAGQIVGFSLTAGNSLDAFLYDGTMHDLGTLPGYSGSTASGINASGQIVGSAGIGFPSVAFLYQDGVMQALGTLPGDTDSMASGINKKGEIVGDSYSGINASIDRHAFLYSKG